MRLSELSGKEIVDIKRAERLGVLGQTDLEINEQDGQITALLIPTVKWFGLRKQGHDIRVPWNHIQKIGSDMIILDVPGRSRLPKSRSYSFCKHRLIQPVLFHEKNAVHSPPFLFAHTMKRRMTLKRSSNCKEGERFRC